MRGTSSEISKVSSWSKISLGESPEIGGGDKGDRTKTTNKQTGTAIFQETFRMSQIVSNNYRMEECRKGK